MLGLDKYCLCNLVLIPSLYNYILYSIKNKK